MRPSLKRIRDRVIEAMRASTNSPGGAALLEELLKIDEQIQREAARDLAFAGMREARSREELVQACRRAQEAIHGGCLPKADFTNPPTSKEEV